MITNQLASKRNIAVREVQQKLHNCTDPYWVRVYEKALDLAFNQDRTISEKFYSRLVNDAKRTVRRDRQGAPAIVSFYINRQGKEQWNENLAVDPLSPEDILQTKQQIDWIGAICRGRHKSSLAVFQCMLEGHKVAETAKKLAISPSMVKKLRVEIKAIAERILTF